MHKAQGWNAVREFTQVNSDCWSRHIVQCLCVSLCMCRCFSVSVYVGKQKSELTPVGVPCTVNTHCLLYCSVLFPFTRPLSAAAARCEKQKKYTVRWNWQIIIIIILCISAGKSQKSLCYINVFFKWAATESFINTHVSNIVWQETANDVSHLTQLCVLLHYNIIRNKATDSSLMCAVCIQYTFCLCLLCRSCDTQTGVERINVVLLQCEKIYVAL